MNKSHKQLFLQNSNNGYKTDVDVIKCLEQRRTGSTLNYSSYSHDFKMYAEDVFVKKKLKELKCEMPGTPRSTFLMVFSPDGSKVASTHGNHNIYVTDARNGKNIKTLVGHPRTPWCIAFHPTSNQILASGCLGGQVRIWDLSGGSEIWTSEIPTVIASIAFHPDDRLLVIATYNELHFWDWSKPEPFIHIATTNIKEKVRYVAFDKLGQKLITGISNSPQTRWERVRAPVPVPGQVDRSASPYRRRITPRLITNMPTTSVSSEFLPTTNSAINSVPLTTVPERERRITACYRNLVREYELLVHRYLQIYRPPAMIDQGTDPMEIDINTVTHQHLNGSNSQSRTPIDAATPNFLPRSELSDTTQINSSQAQSLGGTFISLGDLPTINSNRCTSPIGVPADPILETLNIDSTNSRCRTDYVTTNNMQIVPQAQGSVSVSGNAAHSGSDGFGSSLSEAEITRQNVQTSRNVDSSIGSVSLNEDDRMLSGSHTPVQIEQFNEDNSQHYKNNLKYTKSREIGTRSMPLRNCSRRNTFTDSLNLINTDSNVVKIRNSIQNSAPKNRSSFQSISKKQSSGTVRLKNTFRASVADLNTTKCNEETKNISNSSGSIEAIGLQNKDCVVNHLPITSDYMIGVKQTHSQNLKSQDGNADALELEPRPSTSGIHTQSSENYFSYSDLKFYQSKKKNARMCGQSFKRSSNTLSRKTNTDSSSDSSGSEGEILSSKRLCIANLSSLSPKPAVVDANSNPTKNMDHISDQEQTASKAINLNRELEGLVKNLLMSGENTQNNPSESDDHSQEIKTTNAVNSTGHTCDNNLLQSEVGTGQSNITTSRKSKFDLCPKNSDNIRTSTTNSSASVLSRNQRYSNRAGRFFSHRTSAFYPIRVQTLRPCSRLRRNGSYLSATGRNRLRMLNTLQSPNRVPSAFAPNEITDYSERVTDDTSETADIGFHPFDPPPELNSIHPENIGIGNMYSNIIQELESSLNDVRNIRASNRLGETSDMLSTFSERLESIMNQSNTILRNLRTSIDILQPSNQNITSPNNVESAQSFARTTQPSVSFSDSNFYLRGQTSNQAIEENVNASEDAVLGRSRLPNSIFSSQNSLTTDHTYPLNSRTSELNANSMSPLMASLHLTVSHIQRQARLLRQQVESIERIDRAMLEVAQLQMMRQMFIEIQCYFRTTVCNESLSSLSRVRQMMAGTRISDSSPYDSLNENSINGNHNSNEVETHANDSTNTRPINYNSTRKTYWRYMFPTQRHFRRGSSGNILQRRSRERLMRRLPFKKSFVYHSLASRTPIDLSRNRDTENNQLSVETLRSLTRRLENSLTEHGRQIGRILIPNRSNASTDNNEYVMMLRLNQCRTRLSYRSFNNYNIIQLTNSVTTDGSSRYNAREVLTASIEYLSRHFENNANVTPSLRGMIQNVIDLSLLLSEILLLQIVDSIPPPSGMNLDSERESLSARIDQMCSRMLQNRLSGHSQQLTRSLRLTRLAVRHAARALNQTYTTRRNSMLSTDHSRDQRRLLLEEINNCLHSIRRHGVTIQRSDERIENNTDNLTRTQWYQTIHNLITRYRCSTIFENSQIASSSNNTNTDNAVQTDALQSERISRSIIQVNNDNDNEFDWYNNHNNNNIISNNERIDIMRPLYRTNNVNLFNLLNNDQNSSASARNYPWNIPTVQINDVPISQYQSQWHPRFLNNRRRMPDRISELRTYPVGSMYRPRFLHPFHASNPFEVDFDETVREHIYDTDIMTPITPNHRIQVWEFSSGMIPNIDNALKNVVVNECKIHNDASVDIANNGNILVTLLPSGGYLNGTNRLGIYSLKWETLGQCLYITNFEQNAVSVSLSPLSRHLLVGLASRRVSVIPSEKWTMAKIFFLDDKSEIPNQLVSVREVEHTRDPNYMSVNCIRWLPISGQGLVYATNTGQLRILT